MKKTTVLLLFILALITGTAAFAEEAVPVFELPEETAPYAYRLTDDDPDSRCVFKKGQSFIVKELKGVSALFIEWYDLPEAVNVVQYDAEGNVLKEEPVEALYETMFTPEPRAESVSFFSDKTFSVSECRPASEEEAAGYVPLKLPEKTDLMLILAHNGDETRYLPGLTVYYRQRGASVVSVYLSAGSRTAIRETIAACRASGIENQPVFLGFKYIHVDERFQKVRTKIWKKEDALKALTGAVRRYRPEVVVTHAQPGEDSDCVNRYASELAVLAVEQAATGKESVSKNLYGSWEVKKTYLHADPADALSNENGSLAEGYCRVDTAVLKDSLGLTGCECAQSLIGLYHTLDIYRIKIEEQPLYFKAVKIVPGPDTVKGDLFENVPFGNNGTAPFAFEVKQAEHAADGAGIFLDGKDGAEEVVSDADAGHWSYKSDSLSIEIERRSETKADESPVVYYVADIRMRNYDSYRSGFGYYLENGSAKSDPWVIARRYKAILAITGDNLVNNEKEKKGVLIRNGQLYSPGRNRETTLALLKDMSLKIYGADVSADVVVEDGVQNSYGFGPVLVENGLADPALATHRLNVLNPRCGIGMVEPGHYVAIVADGRQRGYSVGFTLEEFADAFVREGCTVAYNMDGGISAGMVFMGEHINRHMSAYSNSSSQRPWPDALMFGYSKQIPDESDPIVNNGNYQETETRKQKLAEKNGN